MSHMLLAGAEQIVMNPAFFAGGVLVVLFGVIFVYASRYMKVGPNEALIISGRGTSRIIRGGSTFVWPIFEKVDVLSLEVMSIEIKGLQARSSSGHLLAVDGLFQVKIGSEEPMIRIAAEQFLTRTLAQIEEVAQRTVERHLRASMGALPATEVTANPEPLLKKMREAAAADLAGMGLVIVSGTLDDVSLAGASPGSPGTPTNNDSPDRLGQIETRIDGLERKLEAIQGLLRTNPQS